MISWTANATDYQYLDRNPDPMVTPIRVHWDCTDTDQGMTGRVYGADGIGEDQPEFLESQMQRVTTQIMLDWLHTYMGTEWKAAQEAAATAALDKQLNPDYGSTPPDDA